MNMSSIPTCVCYNYPCSKRKPVTVNRCGVSMPNWCSPCQGWGKQLTTYHHDPASIKWKNQDSREWPKSYEAIAGVFMQMSGTVNFGDVSCSRQIWLSCKECFKTEDKESMKRLLDRVGKCRNKLIAHNPKLQLTEREKSDIFDTLKDLLRVAEKVMGKSYVDKCLESLDKINDLTIFALTDIKKSLRDSTESQGITLKALKGITDLIVLDVTERLNKIQDDLDKVNESIAVLIVMMPEIHSFLLRCYTWAKRIYKAVIAIAILIFVSILLLVVLPLIRDGDRSHLSYKGGDQIARLSPGSIGNNRTVFYDNSSGCVSEIHDEPLLSYLFMHRKKKFIGREWVIQILEERVLERNTYAKGVLMTAHFGFGKSAIAAQLICARENEVGWNLRKHVVAFHVCKYENEDTKNPLQFIKRLISFLSTKSEEYRQYISEQNDSIINNDVKCAAKIISCFDIAIKNPLDILQIPDDEPWIVVIDALDECVYKNDDQNRILELLSDRLIHLQQQVPTWFKFIVISRNITSIQTLEKLETVHLASNNESNYNDIHQFILGVLNISFEDFPSVEDLVKNSEGNFLYVNLALEYLKESENLSQENIEKLPKKMEDIYEFNFDRLFARNNDFNIAKPIFQLMGVKNFMNAEFVVFLELSNVTDATQFERIMEKLSSFVISDFYVTFRHISLYEWLISENNKRYRISLREGHVMISKFLFSLFSELLETELYSMQYRNDRYVDRIFLDLAYHASETDDKDIQNKFLLLDLNVSTLIQDLHLIVSSSDLRPINMFKLIFNMCQRKGFEKMYYTSIKRTLDRSITFSRLDILTYLHENVMHLNESNSFLLHKAASCCNADIVRYLIDVAKLSPTLINSEGQRASDKACSMGCVSVLKLLIKKDPDVLDMQCLWYAAVYGHLREVSDMYLNHGNTLECIGKLHQMEKLNSLLLLHNQRSSAIVNFATYSKHAFLHAIIIPDRKIFENKKFFSQENIFYKTMVYKYEYSKLWSCSDIQGFTPGLLTVALNKIHIFSQVLDHAMNKTCQSVSSGILYLYYYILHFRILNTHHNTSFKHYIWLMGHELLTNLSCPRGASMEHLLMRHRRIEMIKLLVTNGYTLDWDKTDLKGRTPLDYAKQDFIEGLEFHLGVNINVLSDKERLARLCQCKWDFFVLLCLLCVGSCICALITVFSAGYFVI